jgi:hypothetical protein
VSRCRRLLGDGMVVEAVLVVGLPVIAPSRAAVGLLLFAVVGIESIAF